MLRVTGYGSVRVSLIVGDATANRAQHVERPGAILERQIHAHVDDFLQIELDTEYPDG